MSTGERVAIAAAASYLFLLGWAMQRITYDVWGALVTVPVLVVLSVPLVRRAFSGELEWLRPYAWGGLGVKFAGSLAGYQIRFQAYGGAADASGYHSAGKILAGDVRSGLRSPLTVIPSQTGTPFIEQLTGLVYTIFGSSRLGGFMVFTWFSYWGLVLSIKAAAVAIPGLATRRYTVALFLFPSLVYWGSSTGKEAFVGLCLGLAAYGTALLLSRGHGNGAGVLFAALGATGAAYVRPHYGAIWVGAIAIALFARVALDFTVGRGGDDQRKQLRVTTIALAAVAVVGFTVVASFTLRFLDPPDETETSAAVDDRLSNIFDTVETRTGQGGSSFTPIVIGGPQDWPYAAYRTLTRPLIIEARGLAELLPAVEMTGLLFVGLLSWRRLVNTPKLMLTTPYLLFALLCVGTFGVAFASIGNLGILTRQRSLVLPLLLVFFCLPPLTLAERPSVRRAAAILGRPAPAGLYGASPARR